MTYHESDPVNLFSFRFGGITRCFDNYIDEH